MIRHILLFLLATLYLCPVNGFSCGNEYLNEPAALPRTKGGLHLSALLGKPGPYWKHGFGDAGEIALLFKKEQLAALAGSDMDDSLYLRAIANHVDFRLISDAAWHELRAGNRKIALSALKLLEKIYPGRYNIVANLGTAYEVNGDNVNALRYIREAVALNPESHFGSEWIHVKILEAKVNGSTDLTTIILANRGISPDGIVSATSTHPAIHRDSLLNQLAFQLHERIAFIPAPDSIVYQLLSDFASLVQSKDSAEAKPFFNFAASYKPQLPQKIPADSAGLTLTAPASIENKHENNKWIRPVLISALIALVLGGLGYYVSRRKKKSTLR